MNTYLIRRKLMVLLRAILMSGLLISAIYQPTQAATIPGADYGGADLAPANGDVLSGTFINVGTFWIQPGYTVYVDPGTLLSIQADTVVIEGTLNGNGAGYVGGITPLIDSAPGVAGSGPGGGAGGNFGACVHGPGGGGGGYGGIGGGGGMTLFESPLEALGGPSYGIASSPGIEIGSGGGSAANHGCGSPGIGGAGGNGGGGIQLSANTIIVDGGTITSNGSDGQPGVQVTVGPSGGGGGSGGGIWLNGCIALINNAELSATGGKGGDGYPTGFNTGGGGGGGGRVKLSGILDSTSVFSTGAVGGDPGDTLSSLVSLYPSGGASGSVVDSTTTGNCLTETTTLAGDGYSDGWVLERAENYDTGYQIDNKTKLLRIGDDRADRQYKTILSFDTSTWSSLSIQGATLKVKPYGTFGDTSDLGQLCMQAAGGYFGNSWRLESLDFQAPGSGTAASCATMNADGWHEFSVAAGDINTSGWSQFRLYFQLDDNDNRSDDYLQIYDGSTGNNAPVLEVQYMP